MRRRPGRLTWQLLHGSVPVEQKIPENSVQNVENRCRLRGPVPVGQKIPENSVRNVENRHRRHRGPVPVEP